MASFTGRLGCVLVGCLSSALGVVAYIVTVLCDRGTQPLSPGLWRQAVKGHPLGCNHKKKQQQTCVKAPLQEILEPWSTAEGEDLTHSPEFLERLIVSLRCVFNYPSGCSYDDVLTGLFQRKTDLLVCCFPLCLEGGGCFKSCCSICYSPVGPVSMTLLDTRVRRYNGIP